jgi:hypothetical protein
LAGDGADTWGHRLRDRRAGLLGHPKAKSLGWMTLARATSWGLSVLLAGLFVTSYEQRWNSTVEPWGASLMFGGLGLGVAYGLLQQAYPHGVLSGWLWRALFVITVVLVTVPQILSAGSTRASSRTGPSSQRSAD